jgi:hypothetical protein
VATTKSSAVAWYRSRNKNLKAETDALAASLYGLNSEDEHQRYLNYQTYKREVIRNFVLYLHLALEDLAPCLFDFLVKRNKQLTKKKAIQIVNDLWSADLVEWCARLKLVKPKQYKQLIELNRRNKCGTTGF